MPKEDEQQQGRSLAQREGYQGICGVCGGISARLRKVDVPSRGLPGTEHPVVALCRVSEVGRLCVAQAVSKITVGLGNGLLVKYMEQREANSR